MRKMIVEIDIKRLNPVIDRLKGNMLDIIESYELVELLRTDFERGIKVHVSTITIKEGRRYEEIKWPGNFNVLELGRDGRKYILLFSARAPNRAFKMLMDRFNLNVIPTSPTRFWDGTFTFSVIGEEEELRKMLKRLKFIGHVNDVSYHRAIYQEHNLLSVLTDRQKELLIEAKKLGYYDYPRRIDAGGLAGKIGLSKTTVLEHLRKAEGRLVKNLLAGY